MLALIRGKITALARDQRGFVTRQQLFALGATRSAIDHAIATGWLIPVYSGIYAIGHLPTLPQSRAFAATLACGHGAVLSHDSAAVVWGIYGRWTTPFHVTTSRKRERPGIHVHRSKLSSRDVTRQLGIPVTTPARTLLDLAPGLTEKRLTRAVNDLRHAGYLSLGDLADVLERFPRARGARRLRPFVEHPRGPTRSDFEDVFQAFCARYDLPVPLVNTTVYGFEVDAFFPVERVIVELDSWEFHASRTSFISDRDQDTTMLAHGIPTVRITWERLTGTPEREAPRLKRILAKRRAQAA
jgi:hypothetical protein